MISKLRRFMPLLLAITFTLSAFKSHAADFVTFYLIGQYVQSGEIKRVEVIDTKCNENKGVFSLSKNQRVSITICTANSNYGGVLYRDIDLGEDWITKSLISDGDGVKP